MAAFDGGAMEDTTVMEEADEEFMEVRYEAATAAQNDTMMEYDLSGLYDIDNINELNVDLTSSSIDCHYHIIAIPKADSYGYLAAEVKTSDIQEIIDTNAAIYHNDIFLGNTYLSVDPNKETYDISLGKDESIRLKRKQVKKLRSNVLLKGQTKIDFVYEIEIASQKNKDAKISLYDQLPVSNDKSIDISIDDISNAKHDEKTGELKWEFELAPNEKKTFTIAYSVAWPKDKKIDI